MKRAPELIIFKGIIQLSFLLFSVIIFSRDIHVAKNGINALTGRGSESAPYNTISYLFNNNLVNSGDVIIVHQGFYRETVTINVNNITLKPNGNDQVVISGANWYGDSNWQADNSRPGVFKLTLNSSQVETDFTQLFVNQAHQQVARFPNNTTPYKDYIVGRNREMTNPLNHESGFATLLNGSKPSGTNQTGQVTFSSHNGISIIPNVTFTNEAIVRGFIGKLRNNIFSNSQDGGQVTRAGDRLVTFKSYNTQGNTWGSSAAVSQPEGFGYVMDLSLLDYEGEWFYKKTENTLYYKPEGGSITGKNFEIRRRRYNLKVEANNVNIEDIDFRAGEVEIKNSQNTTFTRCTFTYMTPFHYRRTYGVFRQGIVLNNADYTTFESCYIGHTWGSGIIILKGSDNSKINNCILEDLGWMGQFTVAVENNGNNTEITHNTFGRTSRFHIRTTESVYAKITDNDFYEAMAMGEDAGSIMCTSTGKSAQLNMNNTLIAWNKIHDINGIPAYDTDPFYRRIKVVALYLEDVDNYTVHHNLVYNIRGNSYTSVRLNNGTPELTQSNGDIMYLGPRDRNLTRTMNYFNNTFWNYDYLLTFWHRTSTADVQDLNYKNNIFMHGKSSKVGNVEETDFATFVQEAAKSPYTYTISDEKNETVINANDHYVDSSAGNFRLNTNSSYNNGGAIVSGITTESNPTLGAWEGNTNELKNRVFNAGSTITSATFANNGLNTENISSTDDFFEVFPNPFKNELTIINSSRTSESPLIVKIYSINGALLLSKKVLPNSDRTSINTNTLSGGVYLMELSYNGNKSYKKLIK